MKAITILGAGVMGSSMCMPLCDNGLKVNLVGTHLDSHIIESVQATGLHSKLNVKLPVNVVAFRYDELPSAVSDETDCILLGVASAGIGWAIEQSALVIKKRIPIVMITKGMQPEAAGLTPLPDVVAEGLKARLGFDVPVAAIGGPCIAGELAARRPTGTVVVSRDFSLAETIAATFSGDYYYARPSIDMMGVELCAAFKNFFAIAVGWAHGRNEVLSVTSNQAKNNNAAAILFDQAVREMLVLTRALGGSAESVWGMAGVGDLYVTCQAGRNSRLGHALGTGLSYEQAKQGPLKGETVEGAELGIAVAASIHSMVAKGVISASDLPLCFALLMSLTSGVAFNPPWDAFHRGG